MATCSFGQVFSATFTALIKWVLTSDVAERPKLDGVRVCVNQLLNPVPPKQPSVKMRRLSSNKHRHSAAEGSKSYRQPAVDEQNWADFSAFEEPQSMSSELSLSMAVRSVSTASKPPLASRKSSSRRISGVKQASVPSISSGSAPQSRNRELSDPNRRRALSQTGKQLHRVQFLGEVPENRVEDDAKSTQSVDAARHLPTRLLQRLGETAAELDEQRDQVQVHHERVVVDRNRVGKARQGRPDARPQPHPVLVALLHARAEQGRVRRGVARAAREQAGGGQAHPEREEERREGDRVLRRRDQAHGLLLAPQDRRYMAKGDLYGFLKRRQGQLNWRDHKIFLAEDVADALGYLHGLSPKVIHRDLKSKNILLDDAFRAKLSDFGISRERSVEDTMTAGVGTIYWTAPEVLMGKKYTEKADIFSFGIVMSELDTHSVPYSDKRDNSGKKLQGMKIVQMVIRRNMRPTFSEDCPPLVKELADRCLDSDPDVRPSAMELLRIIQRMQSIIVHFALLHPGIQLDPTKSRGTKLPRHFNVDKAQPIAPASGKDIIASAGQGEVVPDQLN
ncbi:hypothetical protein ON010_g15713 [Phytophthora cinnamomi]|nr:hypothetical protein ON010_g15713 [Phytophthora cinnamomi]